MCTTADCLKINFKARSEDSALQETREAFLDAPIKAEKRRASKKGEALANRRQVPFLRAEISLSKSDSDEIFDTRCSRVREQHRDIVGARAKFAGFNRLRGNI